MCLEGVGGPYIVVSRAILCMASAASRRNEAYALFPLQPDELMTCDAMLAHEDSRLVISPNHHINSFQASLALILRVLA